MFAYLVSKTPVFLFFGHLVTLFSAVLFALPFVLGYRLKYACYRIGLQSVVSTSLVKLHAKHGWPQVAGGGTGASFSKQYLAAVFETLSRWFAPIQMSTDFHYLFLAMAVSSHPPFTVSAAGQGHSILPPPPILLSFDWIELSCVSSNQLLTWRSPYLVYFLLRLFWLPLLAWPCTTP